MLFNEERRDKVNGGITVFPLFKDVSFYENNIYILFNNYNKQDKSVNVIVLECNDDDIFVKEVLNIKDSEGKYITSGASICKDKDKFIIAEVSMKISQILVYDK